MLTLLQNARIFAPEPLGVCDLLVAGSRIAAVAPKIEPAPQTWPVEALDLEGQWLIPGLIDLHAHLTGGGGEGGAHTRVPPVSLSTLTAAGVTTVVGLLGTDATTRTLVDLLATARGLEHHGITALCYTGSYEVPPPTLTGSVRGDIVHVDRMVAVGEVAISDHRGSQPSYEELVRLAADAHVAGLMTGKAGLLHLHLGDGPRGLELVRRASQETELPSRVWHPTHVNRNPSLWEEAKELLTQGGYADLTAFPEDDPGLSAARCLAEVHSHQLPIDHLTLSSDAGGCLPTFDSTGKLLEMGVGSPTGLLDTLRQALTFGLPLEGALATCTRNAAELFRLSTKGRVRVGADADLVVVTPELRVVHTMAAGRFLVREGKAVVRGSFEV